MPDLTGLSAREALKALAEIGLAPRIVGDGSVFEQDPPAGTPLERGATATLHLHRQVVASGVSQ